MTIESSHKPIRQAGIHAIVVAASVALTLGVLRIFPQLIPSATEADNTQAVEVEPAQAPTLPNNQPRNFVAAAVNRLGKAVVRIDTERTVVTNSQNPFFEDPFFP